MILDRIELFRTLQPAERQALADRCSRLRFPADSFIYHQGQAGDSIYIVVRGRVGISSGGERGQPALLSIVGPGEMFGEMAVLSGVHERTASARTFDQVEALQIHGSEVQALRRSHPAINEVLLDVLLRRVVRLTTQVAELSELDGPTRLFRQLCRLGEVFGTSTGEIPITQQQLASLSGVGLRITSRVLGEARNDGVIETAKSKITVLDWPAVRRRAGWRSKR